MEMITSQKKQASEMWQELLLPKILQQDCALKTTTVFQHAELTELALRENYES